MAKVPLNTGAFEFQFRPGVDPLGGSGWRGMNTEVDAGSLAPGELQYGENIRLTGKGIRNRSGYELALDLGTAAGSIYHFGALPVDNPRTRLWLTALAVFDPDPVELRTGSSVYHLDPTEEPVFQTHSKFFSAAGSVALLADYGTKLYVGERDAVKELVDLTAPVGLNLTDISPTAAAIPIVRYPGYTVRAIIEFDGKLFISLENDTTITSSKIASWDGAQFVDELTAIRPVLAFGIWRDRLVAGLDATAAEIRVRVAGTAPGTWTTITAVGFSACLAGNCMQEYGGKLYIASGSNTIWSYDGVALTLEHTIAGCGTVTLSGCNALTLHNGIMYYGWNEIDTLLARLGRFDTDSSAIPVIDIYKDITTEQPNFKRLTGMKSYRGQIYCGGQQMWVVATALNDVKGTLQVINDTGALVDDFRIVGFLRFP